MIRNLYKYILLIGLVTSLTSCEDFFNKKPYDQTETDDVLTNAKDAQVILNGMYSGFVSTGSYGTYLTTTLDIATDAAYATDQFSNTWGEVYAWRLHPGSSEVSTVWATTYSIVYNANFLIQNLKNIEIEEEEENRILAEAYTGRALLYHDLVRIYAKAYNASSAKTDLGIPYVTGFDDDEPSRNTIEEVYSMLIDDLEKAISLFEDNSESESTFFTKDFANGLLARVYLDMQDYEKAADAATLVIENRTYTLASGTDFTNIWLHDTGNEIIWKVKYTVNAPGPSLGYNFYLRQNQTQLPNPDYIPANNWFESYNQDDDIRARAYFDFTQTGFGWEGNLIYKYPTNPLFTAQGTNMPKPMRIAEMYLIRAEANAHLDKKTEAIEDLEQLLSARISGFDGISENVDLDVFIAQERKKELMFEGFYWFDLKRRGEGFKRVPQANTFVGNDLEITPDNFRWQWPIPRAELNGNSNIQQNPGY
ncbi:RagB/SusD family nutrient uptake outer membrane protein [Saccharicrinis aurantiacus]|uniref:RagB/SusD family nutrient uptake outer membrane protein n=1 Tax=Saccharicrinis aurantiacus TaxID=1849719 RepID=UPI002491D6DF|nr:RagB/SusD family nutrient uptake outer membrane protein [Saccharicrinis aurantiacus]